MTGTYISKVHVHYNDNWIVSVPKVKGRTNFSLKERTSDHENREL